MTAEEKEAFINGEGRIYNFFARGGISLANKKIPLRFPKIGGKDGFAWNAETDKAVTEAFRRYLSAGDSSLRSE